MSPAALKAVFSPDSSDSLITLLTFYNPINGLELFNICDGYTGRIVDTPEEEILYGVVSRGKTFYFLPIEIGLPSEEEAQAPKASIVLHDVTRYFTPGIRSISDPPRVKIELVLSSSPNTVEISFDYFYVTSITYNRDSINCELTMVNLDREPFPMHSFTPQHFPGLF